MREVAEKLYRRALDVAADWFTLDSDEEIFREVFSSNAAFESEEAPAAIACSIN